MSIVLVATIRPLPEHRAEVIETITGVIARVHAEDGCELYALHEADDRLVIIEKWASQETLDVHGKSPALRELGQGLRGKVEGAPDVVVLRPHAAGTAEQGTL
jgi:quinol monooxygenase YgiN